jgi:hypothetical protein
MYEKFGLVTVHSTLLKSSTCPGACDSATEATEVASSACMLRLAMVDIRIGESRYNVPKVLTNSKSTSRAHTAIYTRRERSILFHMLPSNDVVAPIHTAVAKLPFVGTADVKRGVHERPARIAGAGWVYALLIAKHASLVMRCSPRWIVC